MTPDTHPDVTCTTPTRRRARVQYKGSDSERINMFGECLALNMKTINHEEATMYSGLCRTFIMAPITQRNETIIARAERLKSIHLLVLTPIIELTIMTSTQIIALNGHFPL